MTAMPGWQYRLTEDELWDLDAFVKRLPTLSPVEYNRAQLAVVLLHREETAGADKQPNGHPKAGLHAIYQYLCVTCHARNGRGHVQRRPATGKRSRSPLPPRRAAQHAQEHDALVDEPAGHRSTLGNAQPACEEAECPRHRSLPVFAGQVAVTGRARQAAAADHLQFSLSASIDCMKPRSFRSCCTSKPGGTVRS